MSSLPKLSKDLLEELLKSSELDWEILEDGVTKLRKEFKFDTFEDAVAFVDKATQEISKHNHHPDIQISYNKVVFTTWDHEAEGVTQKDLDLAKSITLLF